MPLNYLMVKTFSPITKPPIPLRGYSPVTKVILTADNPVNVGSTIIKVINPYKSEFKLVSVFTDTSVDLGVSISKLSTNLNSNYLVKISSSGSFFVAAVPLSVSDSSFFITEFKALPERSPAIPIVCNLASFNPNTNNNFNYNTTSTTPPSKFLDSAKFVQKCIASSDNSNPSSQINKPLPAVSQDTNITAQKSKIIQDILKRNETLSRNITSLATFNKDHHFDTEFRSLLAWLRSFNSPDHTITLSSLDSYKTDFEFAQANLNLWQKNITILPVSHFTYTKTKYTNQSEAYNFRFVSDSTYETIAPLNLNTCSCFSVLGEDFNTQTNIFRSSSKFNWQRSSQLSVVQSLNYLNQTTNSSYFNSTNSFISTKAKTLQQTNTYKLQVEENYDLIVGQINVDCKTNSILRTEGLIFNESKGNSYNLSKNLFIESKEEVSIKSSQNTNLYAQSTFYISSQGELSLASNSITRIQGSIVQIGMGSSARPIIDLDTNTILNPDPIKAAGIPTTSSSNQVQSAANS